MTLTDAMVGAAALWLLFVLFGMPGNRARSPVVTWEETSLARISGGPAADVVPYSVWHQENPQPRYVTPPLPDADANLGGEREPASEATAAEHVYAALGSATVAAIGLPQVLSLTEVTIAPGTDLTLANLDGSGLIVLEEGWLELAERGGNALLTRSPLVASPAAREIDSAATLAPGDRLSFGSGATIVLRNRGEHPARILAASVVAIPGLDA
ncbi:MAG: hypothetical protein ACRDJC_18800 [Thermomicrobiales bacterium]